MSDDLKSGSARESLAGRLPVLPGERIYNGYTSYMWTGVTFAAATYAFLIGGALPFVGNTKLGLAGYIVGLILGIVPVQMAMGIPSFRLGIDGIDVSKSSFGTRGAIVPLFGVLAASLGWTYVVFAMTGRGAANVIQTIKGGGTPNEAMVVCVAIAMLLGTWILASKGPHMLERLADYISPGHLIITALMLALLFAKYGSALLDMNVDPSKALTSDPRTAFAYGVEFGFANGLSWWPFSGGLSRLVKRRGLIMGPMVLGTGVIGSGFLALVASYAAVAAGTADPTVWMIKVGGNYIGTAIMTFVLFANVATSVVLVYQAGVSIQQVRFFSTIKWHWLVAIILAPGLWVSFHTQWTIDSTMTWLAYNGTIFSGLLAVTFVDYLVLRRENIDVDHIFTRSSRGKYWFWGGINWVAIVVCAGAVVLYLMPYDPITLAVKPWFRYFGAGIPATVISGVVYYVLMKLLVVPSSRGHYQGKTGSLAIGDEAPPPLSL